MTRYIVRVSYDESAFRAAELMRRNKIGGLPVVRGNSVVGMVTDRDLVTRCIAQGKTPIETAVDRIMSQPAICVETSTPVPEAMALMARHKVKRLPVTQGGVLAGMVSLSDLTGAMPPDTIGETYQNIFTGGQANTGSSFLNTLFS
jgi:CBS domain-containing protein